MRLERQGTDHRKRYRRLPPLRAQAAIRARAARGVDVVVEMAGRPEVVSEGVKLLRNGGHYSFVGMVRARARLRRRDRFSVGKWKDCSARVTRMRRHFGCLISHVRL